MRIKPTKKGDKLWKLGTIVEVLEFSSYKVKTESGNVIRRNRIDVIKT